MDLSRIQELVLLFSVLSVMVNSFLWLSPSNLFEVIQSIVVSQGGWLPLTQTWKMRRIKHGG